MRPYWTYDQRLLVQGYEQSEYIPRLLVQRHEKGKGKGKNSVNEVTTPTESTATTIGGTASTSQIARITQDDSLHRTVPMEENGNEEYETGYVLATI